MKRKNLLLFMLIAFAFMPLAMNAETTTVTASKITSASVTWTGSAGETWNVTITGGATNQNVTNGYAQFGTRQNYSTKGTFSTSGISGTITSIDVDCASYNGAGTVSVTVGGAAFGSSQSIPSWSNNAGGTRTFTGSASGSIVVTMTNGSNTHRAMYIKSITVTYTSTTPYITLSPATATVLTGSTQTLTATYGNVTGTPSITYTSSNTSVATVTGSGTSATVTGVAPGTATITASMTYQGTTYTATCTITVEDPSYCTPGTGNYDGSGISNVTFGTNGVVVNNTVGGIAYGNYSNLFGAVEAGTTCQVDITYKTGYTYGTIIWVDWNHNYAFEGTEAVYAGTSGSANPTTLNATFTVPATTSAGDYRMRIIGSDMALDSYTSSLSAAANADPCGSYNYSTCHDYTLRVTPASNCKKPTDLAATNVTKNSATLSWIENGEATAWNISVNGNVTPNVTNPYNLTGLTPETSYTVKVCPVCEDERWSDEITFTTLVACPAPTNLSASNVTNNSAVISWVGDADNYNIRYCTVVETSYDFEDGSWSGWTYYDNDGDNQSWIVTDALGSYTSGDTYVASHGGAYYLRSTYNSSALTENWLISPQINLGGSISFYTERLGGYDDYFKVYVSTTGTSISDFTVEIQGEKEPATDYELVTIDLSNYSGNGYVAIKHYAKENDQAYIFIDDITILQPSSWQYANSHTLTGLDPETTYQVQVQANCGSEDGTSEWVGTTFTTLSNCAVPTNLTATNLSATSADLSWEGVQESYNVRYREATTPAVDDTYGFENGMGGWTMNNCHSNTGVSTGSYTAHSGSGLFRFYYTSTYPQYLISPLLNADNGGTMSFYYARYSNSYTESFKVGYSTTTNDPAAFTWGNEVSCTNLYTQEYLEYTYNIPAGTKYVAIACTSNDQFYLFIDDINITVPGEYGDWVNVTNETSPLQITGLETSTTYEWQVQGVACSGTTNTDWSAVSTFTTTSGYTVAVSVNSSLHGSASITGITCNGVAQEVEEGATTVEDICPGGTVTVTATAAVGYAFDYWGEHNATTGEYDPIEGAEDVYTIENIAANHDLKAFFVESKHWLTIVTQPSNGGTVTVNVNGVDYTDSEVEIPEGATAALTIVAEEGYMVNVINVSGEGSSVNVVTTLPATDVTATFTMGSDDATMTVAFLVPATDIVFDAEDGYEGDESGHWFLFTSPLNGSVSPEEVDNLTSNPDDPEAGYDLYMFDQTGADNGNEWVNYKDSENGGGFDLVAGTGYLYASEFGATLTFHGVPYEGDGVITITNESENKWHGWNLVGNPYYYAEEAWSSLPYYSMNNGAELMSHTAAESLAPMEGFFVYSEDAEGTVTVSTTAPNNGKSASLVLNVSRGRGLLDRAIVSFGDNNTLPKFQLNPSHTKVYIPREERDYAIVSAEDEMGEMPVSFKAEKSGSYTISVTAEGVSFGYLHLIDNMTGNDVDLLQTSSYTFNALDTDYASRFKLVFATGNATGDNFAFYSNGSWVISNEGEATLQVVDVTGRVLRSESVNGCTSVNMSAAPGIYMLRLINGDNVKVQKVVVRR